jgi:hypothetical protein
VKYCRNHYPLPSIAHCKPSLIPKSSNIYHFAKPAPPKTLTRTTQKSFFCCRTRTAYMSFFWQILHTKTIYDRSLCQSGSTKNPTTNKREDPFFVVEEEKACLFFRVPENRVINYIKKDEFYPSLLPRPLFELLSSQMNFVDLSPPAIKKSGGKTRKKK